MLCHHFQIQQHSAGRLLHTPLLVCGCLLRCHAVKHPDQALRGCSNTRLNLQALNGSAVLLRACTAAISRHYRASKAAPCWKQ